MWKMSIGHIPEYKYKQKVKEKKKKCVFKIKTKDQMFTVGYKI